MAEDLMDSLEKLLLAGIGALRITYDKSKEIIDDLVKKGELTVEQGKVINAELKHNIKTKIDEEVVRPVESLAASTLIRNLDKLSADDISALKAKLREMEQEEPAAAEQPGE